MTPLAGCLLVSSILFAVGLAGALTRRNTILVLVGIELMLNAANLNFVAFWRYGSHWAIQPTTYPGSMAGMVFVLFAIGVAAAEAAVGLALILAVYRHTRSTDLGRPFPATKPSGPAVMPL
jgi:NADH-quinone oxidoreductase subunit K